MRRGEVVRFFFTNVSNTRLYNLSFGGAPMKVVGSDIGKFEHEAWVTSIVLAPAERYIVDVQFTESGVTALTNRVQSLNHVRGNFFAESHTLATIDVRSDGCGRGERGGRSHQIVPHAAAQRRCIGRHRSLPFAVHARRRSHAHVDAAHAQSSRAGRRHAARADGARRLERWDADGELAGERTRGELDSARAGDGPREHGCHVDVRARRRRQTALHQRRRRRRIRCRIRSTSTDSAFSCCRATAWRTTIWSGKTRRSSPPAKPSTCCSNYRTRDAGCCTVTSPSILGTGMMTVFEVQALRGNLPMKPMTRRIITRAALAFATLARPRVDRHARAHAQSSDIARPALGRTP